MDAKKGNGLDAANDHPAKTFSQYATYFIAATARFASADNGCNILFLVLALHFVAIVWGVI